MRIGTPRSLHSWATSLDVLGLADVAGVEAQAVHAGLERGERHAVLVVDVGDDRHRRAGHDLRQALGRLDLVARAAHDVGAGARPARRSAASVPSTSAVFVIVIDCTEIGASPPDRDLADMDLAGLAARERDVDQQRSAPEALGDVEIGGRKEQQTRARARPCT